MTEQQQPGRALTPVQRLSQTIEASKDRFSQVATEFLTPSRLIKLAQVAIAKKPELAQCTTISVLDCLMTCARLGLEPNDPGGAWLVPFKDQCTVIIDYRGLIDVCRRSGQVLSVHAEVRYEHDHWKYRIDTTASNLVTLEWAPADSTDRGKMIGAFFVAKLKGGECQATYLTRSQIDNYKARSRSAQKKEGPWITDEPAMWVKTVCRRGVNLMPRTPEIQMLREELDREDREDLVELGELPESNQDAIGRLLADIGQVDKVLSDAAAAGFQALGYGPARQLQILTKYQGQPKELVEFLNVEQRRAVEGTADVVAKRPGGQTILGEHKTVEPKEIEFAPPTSWSQDAEVGSVRDVPASRKTRRKPGRKPKGREKKSAEPTASEKPTPDTFKGSF